VAAAFTEATGMSRIVRVSVLFVLLCGALEFDGGRVLLAQDAAEMDVISGEVEAADFDEDGNVVAVSIYDMQWGAVLVRGEGRGAELLKQVGAIVTATGHIEELDDDSAYQYAIRVESYTVDEPAADAESSDDAS